MFQKRKRARGVVPLPLALGLAAALARVAVVAGGPDAGSPRIKAGTQLGTVVGYIDSAGVQTYLGIRYAQPPVRELRFEAPVAPEPWAPGEYEALEFGPECMQSIANNPTPPKQLSEDCLFLNVWAPPGTRRRSDLPVMVWVFGGGFQQGATSHPEYNGARLAERGVVVVSMNYRLGALGFMVSVDDNLWGNYGLQDQRLALEWVHNNIHEFGGDPRRVTLFGESAGAMSIGLHLLMDGAGTLFHQVIMQSNPLGYRFRSITVANFLGQGFKRALDCRGLACLQEEPAAEIMKAQETLMGVPRSVGDFFAWGPVATDRFHRQLMRHHRATRVAAGEPLSPASIMMNVSQPLEVLGRGHPPVPVLLGTNSDEGVMFVHVAYPLNMNKYVYWTFVVALFRESARGVLRQYGAMADACAESGDYRPVMSRIINDYLFRCPNRRAAHLLQEHGQGPVFMYEFSHQTTVPGYPYCAGLACHTAELPFVFEQIDIIKTQYTFPPPIVPGTSAAAPLEKGKKKGTRWGRQRQRRPCPGGQRTSARR